MVGKAKVGVGVMEGVRVGVGVEDWVGVWVMVGVSVTVGVFVNVGMVVEVDVCVDVGEGVGEVVARNVPVEIRVDVMREELQADRSTLREMVRIHFIWMRCIGNNSD